jgi:hypothetical protein
MRFGRFEFGLIVFSTERNRSKILHGEWDWSYEHWECGCRILSLGKFYLTWLGDECYFETLKERKNEEGRK